MKTRIYLGVRYGYTHEVVRSVVERRYARSVQLQVEVYLLSVEASVRENPSDARTVTISHAKSVGELKALVCQLFGVDDDEQCRLIDADISSVLDEPARCLYDLSLIHRVMLHRKNDDGSWPSVYQYAALGSTSSVSSYSSGYSGSSYASYSSS